MILTIGQLAAQSGCKIATIRYYEEIQLMPEAKRSSGNHRQYYTPDLTRLKFIRHSRELGFSLDDIRELLSLTEATSNNSHQAEAIALKQLEFTQSRIQRLQSLEQELTTMLHQCNHDQFQTCRVIEVLANHQLCQGH